jgi:hypothetical protein
MESELLVVMDQVNQVLTARVGAYHYAGPVKVRKDDVGVIDQCGRVSGRRRLDLDAFPLGRRTAVNVDGCRVSAFLEL